MTLFQDLMDAIDGGTECRGRDSQISRWADMAKRLERQHDELLAALRYYADQSQYVFSRDAIWPIHLDLGHVARAAIALVERQKAKP